MDPRRQRQLWYGIGSVLIVVFLAVGWSSFRKNLTPYVPFEEAMRRPGTVQIAGALVPSSSEIVEATHELRFTLTDEEGRTMPVVYAGGKPGNFEEATQVVAIGSYRRDAFYAEKLLVKCPSKYQGVNEDVSTHGSRT
jgi:cytochrome c-type biogenesis protein CcmE